MRSGPVTACAHVQWTPDLLQVVRVYGVYSNSVTFCLSPNPLPEEDPGPSQEDLGPGKPWDSALSWGHTGQRQARGSITLCREGGPGLCGGVFLRNQTPTSEGGSLSSWSTQSGGSSAHAQSPRPPLPIFAAEAA